MRSYKEQMNSAARDSTVIKELSPEESSALKACILNIYKSVANLCDKNNLVYMLAGGSCLGAVRHHGFIPWDDDLDMMMPRGDYDKLILLLKEGCLGKDYSFSYPDGKHDSPVSFMKIYKNNTVLVNITDGEKCPFPQKVFLDVFPLDGAPINGFVRKLKGIIADGIRLVSNMVYDSRPWTEVQKQFYTSRPELMKTIKKRRFWGKILSVVPHRKWVYWFDRFVSNSDMTGMIGIPTGRKHYGGEIFTPEVYLPTTVGHFEGVMVPLPGNFDAYLTNLYHNYMELPPVEKRERHFVICLEL